MKAIVSRRVVAFVFSLGFLCVSAQTSTKEDPIEASAGKWNTQCFPKGCLMFTYVLIGDPDHPADVKHPEFITIAVAINRSDRKPAYFDFHLPPDSDRSQGFYIAFGKTTGDGKSQKSTIDKAGTAHLDFLSCDQESCIGRALYGIVKSSAGDVDLLNEFLASNHILFLFTRKGEAYRTIKSLFPFKRDYQRLMETEFK